MSESRRDSAMKVSLHTMFLALSHVSESTFGESNSRRRVLLVSQTRVGEYFWWVEVTSESTFGGSKSRRRVLLVSRSHIGVTLG